MHTSNFGGVFIFTLFQFSIFGGVFNKTIIPLALVGYAHRWLLTRIRGIIVHYPTLGRETFYNKTVSNDKSFVRRSTTTRDRSFLMREGGGG